MANEGLSPAGVILEARNYQDYTAKLSQINKLQKEAFSQNTFKDFQKAADDISKRTQAMSKSMESTWDVVSNLRSRLNDAASSGSKIGGVFSKINDAIKPLVGDFGRLAGEIAGFAAKFTLVATVLKAVNDLVAFGQAAIAVAQRNETLRVSLETVGEQAGYSVKQIDLATQLLQKQGITTQAAQQSLLRMARANISWAEASKLAAIAQGSAVVAGINSSDAFERLVTGIQKMEPELLDELGITLNRTKAYEKFGATIGKNAKDLSDAEKQQAILNEIYRQSESVIGVYGAAMETSGKRQASLARLIEETQNNLGKLLLPLQAASVDMQTNFWKATQTVTKGLQSWTPLLTNVIPGAFDTTIAKLKDFAASAFGIDDSFNFWDRIGEGVFNFGKIFVTTLTFTRSVGQTVVEYFMDSWGRLFEMLQKGFSGDFSGAIQVFKNQLNSVVDFPKQIGENFTTNMTKVLEEYPELLQSWDGMNKGVEGSSEDLRLAQEGLAGAAEDAEEAIKKQIETLEATKSAYDKAKSIQENFTQKNQKAWEDYQQGLADAEKKHLDDRAKKIADFNKKLAEFDADNARKRAQMVDDFEFQQVNRVKEFALQRAQQEQAFRQSQQQKEQKFYQDNVHRYQQYQLALHQEQRRNQATDKRLRAEGDVLALMQAREDAALQQQEAKENFDLTVDQADEAYWEQRQQAEDNFKLQEDQARQSFRLQTEIQREEFQRRLAEFDENLTIQRDRMIEANEAELAELDKKYEEEKTRLLAHYEETMQLNLEQRDKELQELGDALKAEGKVTEEGMKEIADKISEVFGDDAAGDKLIKGWSERSQNEFNNLVDNLNSQIERLKQQMESATQAVTGSSGGARGPGARYGFGANPSTITGGGRPIGARSGFNGVVTGPKTFQIEPGMREHVQITPMSRFGGNVTVSGSTRHEIIGGSSGMGDAMGKEIANMLVDEIRVAVKRLNRRGT